MLNQQLPFFVPFPIWLQRQSQKNTLKLPLQQKQRQVESKSKSSARSRLCVDSRNPVQRFFEIWSAFSMLNLCFWLVIWEGDSTNRTAYVHRCESQWQSHKNNVLLILENAANQSAGCVFLLNIGWVAGSLIEEWALKPVEKGGLFSFFSGSQRTMTSRLTLNIFGNREGFPFVAPSGMKGNSAPHNG